MVSSWFFDHSPSLETLPHKELSYSRCWRCCCCWLVQGGNLWKNMTNMGMSLLCCYSRAVPIYCELFFSNFHHCIIAHLTALLFKFYLRTGSLVTSWMTAPWVLMAQTLPCLTVVQHLFSHKFNDLTLWYKVGIDILSGFICWISGPQVQEFTMMLRFFAGPWNHTYNHMNKLKWMMNTLERLH